MKNLMSSMNCKMYLWDSLIDNPEHLRLIKKKSIVPSRETMLYVLNIGRFHGPDSSYFAKIEISF